MQTELLLLNTKIFKHGGKSSCKITPCMHFLRRFKSVLSKCTSTVPGERINSVCCQTGLYPEAGDQPQVPPQQGDVGVAKPFPSWYPAGLALCSITRVPHQTHWEERDFFFSMYLKQTNRAETVSEAAFLNAPFAGWEIQREHPLQACPLKDLPPNSSVL